MIRPRTAWVLALATGFANAATATTQATFASAAAGAADSAASAPATSAAASVADSFVVAPVDSATATPATLLPPQRDVIDVLAAWVFDRRLEPQIEVTTKQGIAWSILPTLSYNPVYGFAFGASASGSGILGREPDSRSSALSVSGNYSTTGQVQAQFKSDLYTPSGDYLLRADVRYLDTDRSTWGLGPFEAGQEEFPMEFALVRLYATLYRHISGPVYFGFGYHFDEFDHIVDVRAANGESTPFSTYSGPGVTRTRATGVSINLLGDTRDNLVNPTRGYYLSGSFRDYLTRVGSDANWQEYWLDVRLYPHLPASSNNILAFWLYSWFSFGPGPYLDLPAVGWDTYGRGGRGYLQGRMRAQNQLYFESEYRMGLTRDGLLGAVFFYNFTVSALPEAATFSRADSGFGLGLRIKFNKRSNTNLALDHGWGEGSSRGWFMGMTEVF